MTTPDLTKFMVLAVIAAMPGTVHADSSVMRAPMTEAQLIELQRQAAQNDPMKKQPVAKTEETKAEQPIPDLISQSDVLSFQGLAALVPKRAVLQVPKNYRERLAYQPGAKLVGWSEFYVANRGWITIVEVNQKQAQGKLPLPDETHKMMSKSSNLVIATFFGSPVSVLPLKEPEATDPKQPVSPGTRQPSTPVTKKP
jgi:hypothetical protein